MAKLVYGLNQSLDGYVDHQKFVPRPALFRHFIEDVRGLTGMVYGRRMYEVMRYWDGDHAEWNAEEREYAAAWRGQPKWVASRSLKSVGPNATLVSDDIEVMIRGLKAQFIRKLKLRAQIWPEAWSILLMSIEFTCTLSCLVAVRHSSPALGRHSALLPAI